MRNLTLKHAIFDANSFEENKNGKEKKVKENFLELSRCTLLWIYRCWCALQRKTR